MKVNICGIPHKVIECEDKFNADCHFGMIDYQACEIRINKDMPVEAKKETLFHEMLHGMLIHLGYSSYSSDEQFVQALSNAIYQSFEAKLVKEYSINEINEMVDKIGVVNEEDFLGEVQNESID